MPRASHTQHAHRDNLSKTCTQHETQNHGFNPSLYDHSRPSRRSLKLEFSSPLHTLKLGRSCWAACRASSFVQTPADFKPPLHKRRQTQMQKQANLHARGSLQTTALSRNRFVCKSSRRRKHGGLYKTGTLMCGCLPVRYFSPSTRRVHAFRFEILKSYSSLYKLSRKLSLALRRVSMNQ